MVPENKIGLPRIKNQGQSRWQRDALPLSYARIFKNYYKAMIFFRQEILKF